jgi:hypothetical protein
LKKSSIFGVKPSSQIVKFSLFQTGNINAFPVAERPRNRKKQLIGHDGRGVFFLVPRF